jgi:hypothetical protein
MSRRWWTFWKGKRDEPAGADSEGTTGGEERAAAGPIQIAAGPIQIFETVMSGSTWVLFEHGTCVKLSKLRRSPTEAARSIMAEYRVIPGTPLGDFNTLKLKNFQGWLIAGCHPDVFTYVSPAELPEEAKDNAWAIGLWGRNKRDRDARELNVVHVADGAAESP